MTELQKHRDQLCKDIDDAMEVLSQVKEVIAADNMSEVYNLALRVEVGGVNLRDKLRYYADSKYRKL